MKKRNLVVLCAVVALGASACEYSKTLPMPETPVPAVSTENITSEFEDQADEVVENAQETPETAPSELMPPEDVVAEVPIPQGPAAQVPTLGVARETTPSILRFRESAPTLGVGCGEGAVVTGNHSAGRVTMGTGASNYCKITFDQPSAFTVAPICTASPASTDCQGAITVGTTTADAFFLLPQDVTVNFNANCSVNYICVPSE